MRRSYEDSLDAEFVEVIDSVSNVWSDEADGSETFVVEEDLKDYLIEEFYEETFEGLFSVSTTQFRSRFVGSNIPIFHE